jgi:hypothetical protein
MWIAGSLMPAPLPANSPSPVAAPLAVASPPPAHPLPPILSYAAPGEAMSRRTPMRVAQLVLALPGLVAPFVVFTLGTSPLDCVKDWDGFGQPMFLLLGSSFFAAFPIVAWQVRQFARAAAPTPWERAALTIVAVIALAPATAVVSMMVYEFAKQLFPDAELRWDEILMLLAGLAPLVTGVALSIARRRRGQAMAAIETLLVTGYLANAAICLLGFHSDPELGYWLTVSATASFAIDWLRPRA